MFDDTFRVCFADTPFGVALHQRIRYQVYRIDKGHTFPGDKGDEGSAFSAERETDAWDERSAHFIVQNKNSGQWVAATRLVLPRREGKLPVDALAAFERDKLENPNLPAGEISRFCIIGNRSMVADAEWRDSHADSLAAWGIGPVGKHQQFAVTLGMMRATGIFALKRGIDHCVLMITDPFARLLRTLGVTLQQVGPPTEYLGMRTTYLVDMREAVSSMAKRSSEVRTLFRRAKHAYVRISSVMAENAVDTVSEYAPDHSLFNETIFRETVLLPADGDSDLQGSGPKAR